MQVCFDDGDFMGRLPLSIRIRAETRDDVIGAWDEGVFPAPGGGTVRDSRSSERTEV
jgi:hypothetical protein